MLGRTDSRSRLLVLLLVFVIAAVAVVGRLAYWQVLQRDDLAAKAVAQTTKQVSEPSRRGDIYDRSGTVVLATTVERDRLVANAKVLTPQQREATGDELVRILTLGRHSRGRAPRQAADRQDLHHPRPRDRAGGRRPDPGRDRGPARSPGSPSRPSRCASIRRPAAVATRRSRAQLLGFVNREGTGQYGVEQAYQDTLGGSPRIADFQRDARGQPIPETATVVSPGTPGQDVRLTIDAGLQLAVEQELLAAYVADDAKSVSAIVMDPYTGEVYAEATYPSYDANDYRAIAAKHPERFIDPIVSSVYEPGSVFKMMTATAALEHKSVTLDTRIKDTGTLKLDGGRAHIDDADRKGMGWMTFEDGVAFSRNVVAAKVALDLAPSTRASSAILYDTWLKLGFGAKTGIDLANEVSGIVRDPGLKPWAQIDLANGAFGQGVAVTPIQLATAYAALMNGGSLVQPHVVKAIGEREIVDPPKAQGHRPAPVVAS